MKSSLVIVTEGGVDALPGFAFDTYASLARAMRCSHGAVWAAVKRIEGESQSRYRWTICCGVTLCFVEDYSAVCFELDIPMEELV